MVGKCDEEYAYAFIEDLASRLANRVQLTTDGHGAYLQAVEDAFDRDIDYAMLVKHYSNPDIKHVSTSHVERQNLTMRMGMRRFTQLTNGFGKKIENLEYSVALHFMHYNFGRIHKSLRVTPAMAAGISGHVWSLEEIAALVPEPVAKKRGNYNIKK